MNKRTEREIDKIFKEIFKKIYKEVDKTDLKKGSIDNLIYRFKNSKQYEDFCKEFSKKLAQQGLNKERGLWRKYFEAAKMSHIVALPKTFSEFEIKMYRKVVRQNFHMIKSIPEEVAKVWKYEYVDTLIAERLKGTLPRGAFQKKLMKAGAKKAELIARTESAKLETFIVQSNATELGSILYRWSSTKDVRTRPSHKKMNGVYVFWKDKNEEKPLLDEMYGNAGEFPNCRCVCVPIFDLTGKNDKSSYEVYDYKAHKVITMSKKQLEEKIKKERGE